MKAWTEYIAQFGQLSPEAIGLLLRKAVTLELDKDAYYLQAGKISRRFGFLLEGIMRVSYFNNREEEITKYFIDENNIVVDLQSFDNNQPSVANVQAMTPCRLVVFSKEDWDSLLDTIPGWAPIVRKIISKALLQKVERISPLVAEDATTRYLSFMERYPHMANRIPLAYLASYLGITPSSLSRIRKNIR